MDQKPQYRNYLMVSVVLTLVGIAAALGQFKIPSIMPAIMDKFSMDLNSASMLMSVFTLTGIFLSMPAGMLARRFGAKNMTVVAVGVLVLGTMIGCFATSGSMLVFSRAIEGVALVFCGICAPLVIRKYVSPDKVGFASGVWSLWFSLGSFLGGVLTPTLYGALGFQGTWLSMAGLALVLGLLLLFCIRPESGRFFEKIEHAVQGDGAAPLKSERAPSFKGLLTRDVLLTLGGFAMFNIVLISFLTYSPTFLQEQGMSPTMAGFASTLPMLIAIVSSPVFGVLADKTHRYRLLLVAAMAVLGPCACVLLTNGGTAMWIAAAVLGVVGLGAPPMFLIAYPAVVENKEQMPLAMGLLVMTQSLGQFVGSLVMPHILGFGWMVAGAVVLVLGLVGAGLLLMVNYDAYVDTKDNAKERTTVKG